MPLNKTEEKDQEFITVLAKKATQQKTSPEQQTIDYEINNIVSIADDMIRLHREVFDCIAEHKEYLLNTCDAFYANIRDPFAKISFKNNGDIEFIFNAFPYQFSQLITITKEGFTLRVKGYDTRVDNTWPNTDFAVIDVIQFFDEQLSPYGYTVNLKKPYSARWFTMWKCGLLDWSTNWDRFIDAFKEKLK